ncbi:MAG: GFA family protein [bacterium]
MWHVRYEAEGAPVSVIYCHCNSCRKHTGAPVVALAGFKREQVRFTHSERTIYYSSSGVDRGFCCPSQILIRVKFKLLLATHIDGEAYPLIKLVAEKAFQRSGLGL